MPLFFPKSHSVLNFKGGFKYTSDYTDLADTETADALNIEYGPDGDLTSRKGSTRILNSALDSADGTARPITGHYYFNKLGGDSATMHIIAAGDSLHDFAETSKTRILSGLTDNSNTFWSFDQLADPRSASDDVVFGCNGVDALMAYNGSGTAIYVSSITSATSVPIGKFCLSHLNRIYIANTVDAADADSKVRVFRSEIGTDGAPNPHRFTESFYVGGSSPEGEIKGQMLLRDSIYYYLENAIYRFNPGVGDTANLTKVKENIGLLAPNSLVNTGNSHLFLSQRGVYSFDGTNVVHISEKIDALFLSQSNRAQLPYAKGVYDHARNLYILYFPYGASNRNDYAVAFDMRTLTWQPPITGRQVSYISNYLDGDSTRQVIYGDYFGYLYKDNNGLNDGIEDGENHAATGGGTINTITVTSANFDKTNDGLKGQRVTIYDGTSDGETNYITSNTSAVLTFENNWTNIPDTSSKMTLGGINKYWKSKDYSFNAEDITKLFKELNIRCREEGLINLDVHYIIDFNLLSRSTLKQLQMFKSGAVWDSVKWDDFRWDGFKIIRKKMLFRNTSTQKIYGHHIALRFSNERAQERFKVNGFDIVVKEVGRR
jgi:hypothetical protein